MKNRLEYLQNLPRKIIACGILIFNEKNELLILKPSYKEFWTIPGGVIESLESPLTGLKRELKEEISICPKNINLAAIAFITKKHNNYSTDIIQFVFYKKLLNNKLLNKIKIDNKEIVNYKILSLKKAYKLLDPKLSKRIKEWVDNKKRFIYLENGKKVLK